MSQHSDHRCKQRNISALTVELIRKYGESMPSHGGSRIRVLTRRKRRQLLSDLRQVEKNLTSQDPPYLVESSDGEIITAGRRTKRIKR